jgi:hypothetical protein
MTDNPDQLVLPVSEWAEKAARLALRDNTEVVPRASYTGHPPAFPNTGGGEVNEDVAIFEASVKVAANLDDDWVTAVSNALMSIEAAVLLEDTIGPIWRRVDQPEGSGVTVEHDDEGTIFRVPMRFYRGV